MGCYYSIVEAHKHESFPDNLLLNVTDKTLLRLDTAKVQMRELFSRFCSPSRWVTSARPKTAGMGRTKPTWNTVTGACAGVTSCI
jgi:hypothetical protein